MGSLIGLTVLILGAGPIGHAVAQVLKARGIRRILLSEPTELRRKQVAHLVEVVVDPTSQDLVAECRRMTHDSGVDVVFDCAGAMQAMNAAFQALRIRGTYVNVAVAWSSPPVIPLIPFMLKEITIKAALTYEDEDFAAVVADFCAGRYESLESMVTARIGLDDVVEEGFNQLIRPDNTHIKILVRPAVDE
ncbi:putative diacetyl [(R)-acetoin forming] 2 [Cyphellophora attinorum]|uniref:Putative diacetyl [(R)-acetoin forming] 2 n=1 Tax=Cyphellophora attinorum TaxID=1664694 RepID=A0A0N0NIN5_9EURO|nr:putative diacetyl [(R)-acetoin forming] 2 [Phialophora attinorum]KPI35948.1 putative diacetyl [(R)-acetoin forming] 2 [Phialophora attinorum]